MTANALLVADSLFPVEEWSVGGGRSPFACGDTDSAQALAGTLWPLWVHRGYWTEGSQFLRRVLAMASADTRSIGRANSLLGLSHLTEAKGEYAAAREQYLDGLDCSASSGMMLVRFDRSGAWAHLPRSAVTRHSRGNCCKMR